MINQRNNIPFNPIQCTSETFNNLDASYDGALYFITDTKQIYLSKNNKFIELCGGTNIVYGIKDIKYENTGLAPDPNVTFYLQELEEQEMPLIGDLILNADGCFYKVKSIENDEIFTVRLTLQGSGNANSGPNTGDSTSYTLTDAGGVNKIFSTTAEEMLIGFKTSYKGDDLDNHISYVSCTILGEELPFLEMEDIVIPFNTSKYIDLSPYAYLFSTIAKKTVVLEIRDIYGQPRSKEYKIQLVEMSIERTQENIFYSSSNKYTYDCNVNGGLSLSNRRVIYSFYTESNNDYPVKSIEYFTTIDGNVKKELDLTGLEHGTYIMKVQALGEISGTSIIVPSNIITHKILYFTSDKGAAIFSAFIPEKTEQFANIPISALLVTGGSSKTYTVEVKIDNTVNTLKIVAHTPLNYNLMFEKKGNYSLTLTVIELNLKYSTILNITEYTGKLPVIDTNRDDLDLYLNPRGKSNDSIDKNIWTNYDGTFSAQLKDFYYEDINGWSVDELGCPYLKLSQGAKLDLPNYRPFATNAMDASKYGITIELDFKLSSVLDYDKDLISCVSTDKDGIIYAGFKVTGSKAYLYTSVKNGVTGDPVTLNMVENQRIKITYVVEKNDVDFPMVLTYLNGIISNVSKYEKTDRFIDASGDGATPGTLKINSEFGQIDIYSIRIYSAALEQSVVLGNYQASLSSLEEREANFKSNSILTNNKVDLRYMEDEGYELEIPYIKITGGYKAADNKQMAMGVSGGEFALPVGKKDYRLISFELKYPKKGYFAEKGYEDFKELCTFASGKTVSSIDPAYGEEPLTGAVMYAQGTSSLEYPVKNLRVKFKTKKVAVRPGMEPVNLICLKADFMESSGSHNTGAANFVDDVYKMANMKTPGQEYYKDEDIVTSIKGHPVAVFWSPSGSDGTYEYIGKYNFNLDKATPKPFGFKNTPEEYDASATEKFGWDENGENTIRCFEYLDNSVKVCNFLPKEGKTYEETWYEKVTDPITGKSHWGWTEGFESRHIEDLDDKTDADCIYPMASWVNELATMRYGTKTCPTCGEVLAHKDRCHYCEETDLTVLPFTREPDVSQALARFKNEYQCYFNKDYLLGYYLISNMLLMIDSRTKNCMMASWGPEPDGFMGKSDFKAKTYKPLKFEDGEWIVDESADEIAPNNYIWYPIFYDMDTMLGIDNQGYPRLKYYDEDTNSEIYNGDDILWNFVRDALSGEVTEYYGKFESASSMFTASTILPYFNLNQANLANEALFNGDAEYKYIDTFRKGYYDHLNTDAQGKPTYIEPGKGSRLYAAQGDRSMDRQYFVTNRVNYLRGKYQSSNYQSGDRIEFRCYVPTGTGEDTPEENRRVAASIAAIPFNKEFTLTALGPGFAGVRFGQNGQIANHQFTNINRVATVTSQQSPSDLESYILGLNVLSDVGDLSDKYLATFTIKSQNKLKRIILGNDHKDYYNPYWKKKKGSEVEVQSCYLLEEFNMYNCDAYREALNFSACKQLKKLYLTGCGVTTLTLPEGTVIEEMRLPDNLQTLTIKNQNFLTKENFSIGHYEYGAGETRIGGNGKFVDTYENLRYVQILNTPINSYAIATKAPNLQEYHFTNVDWIAEENDSQFCSVFEDEFKAGTQYYKYTIVYTPYETTSFESGLYEKIGDIYQLVQESNYNNDTQYYKSSGSYSPYDTTEYESGLYEKIDLINADGTITRIPVLERLMRMGTKNGIEHSEALTGALKINPLCADGSKPLVNEFDIYYRYNKIYPNLIITYGNNITGEKAYTVEFYRTDVDNMSDNVTCDYNVQTNGKFSLAQLTGENSPAGEPLFLPAKASTDTHEYDFTGIWVDWDTKEEYHEDDFSTIVPFKNSSDRTVMKLVPKFTSRTRYYTITFYDYEGFNPISVQYEFNQKITDNTNTPTYQSRPDIGLGEHERYTFKGWITKKDFIDQNNENPTIIDLSTIYANQGIVSELYPYYEIEDATKVATNIDYFSFKEETINFSQIHYNYENTEITLPNEYIIEVKPEYRAFLSGKITLPSKDKNGRPVTAIGQLSDNSNGITHVYFMPDTQVKVLGHINVGQSGFYGLTNLTTVYFPTNISTLKYIGKTCFSNLENLKEIINLPDSIEHIDEKAFNWCKNLEIVKLPASLKYIGEAGFLGCMKMSIETLPEDYTQILKETFAYCNNLKIKHFGNSTNGISTTSIDNNITHIGVDAFSLGVNNEHITEIFIHSSIVFLGEKCFNNYCSSNIRCTINDGSGLIDIETYKQYFGNQSKMPNINNVDSHY